MIGCCWFSVFSRNFICVFLIVSFIRIMCVIMYDGFWLVSWMICWFIVSVCVGVLMIISVMCCCMCVWCVLLMIIILSVGVCGSIRVVVGLVM